MKDIFIDNQCALRFSNPPNEEYKKLLKWLLTNNHDEPEKNAYLAVSKKLIGEYQRSCSPVSFRQNISTIINTLTTENRLNLITNEDIKKFKSLHFKKHIRLTCNYEDREHIPVVLLSDRKYALIQDNKFIKDLINFPRFRVIAKSSPELIPYDN